MKLIDNNVYKRKTFLVYGVGKTGIAVKDFLKEKGAKVIFYKDGSRKKIKLKKIHMAIISPGISLETELCEKLKRNNIPIMSELDLGYLNVFGNIIAVTGTNGKTTTVTLIKKILKEENTFLVGNIGIPLISICNKTNLTSNIVCEVSSYQLESSSVFNPHIACILNFAPDHLIRHNSEDNYYKIKCKIFQNQTPSDYLVLNYNDKKVLNYCKSAVSQKVYFSSENQFNNSNFNGVYLHENIIYNKINRQINPIMNIDNIKLIGKKNLENILCSIAVCLLMNVMPKRIEKIINEFKPLEHRLEFFYENKLIKYINDSRATNVASAIADISAIEGDKVILFGGSDKGENFDNLFLNLPKDVISVVIYGATKERLLDSCNKVGYKKYYICENLRESIILAKEICKKLDVQNKIYLMLCPACASFDEFKNFQQRGEFFKNFILNGELNEKRNK